MLKVSHPLYNCCVSCSDYCRSTKNSSLKISNEMSRKIPEKDSWFYDCWFDVMLCKHHVQRKFQEWLERHIVWDGFTFLMLTCFFLAWQAVWNKYEAFYLENVTSEFPSAVLESLAVQKNLKKHRQLLKISEVETRAVMCYSLYSLHPLCMHWKWAGKAISLWIAETETMGKMGKQAREKAFYFILRSKMMKPIRDF